MYRRVSKWCRPSTWVFTSSPDLSTKAAAASLMVFLQFFVILKLAFCRTELHNTRESERAGLVLGIFRLSSSISSFSLDKVRKKSPAVYLTTLSKLMPYFLPKKIEVDSPTEMIINVKRRG